MSLSPEVIEELKSEWLSELPSSWRFARFGDVLHIKRRPIEMEDHVEYIQPVIRRGHGGIEIRERQLGACIKTKAQFLVHAGDWLMSKVQILHRAYGVVPPELNKAIASSSYYAFEIQKDLDHKYLWYLSHANAFHKSCELASVGVVIEKMVFRATDWLDFEFPLPPLHEQRRIAEILSSVDEAIAATRAVVQQTRKVKQGALERLLTKGIGHTRFKQTEIGEIPEGWEVVNLFDALREPVRNGYSPVSPPSPTGGWLLSLGSLSNDGLTGENLKPAPLDDPRMGAARLSYGDVLISRSNTPDRVGMVGIYKGQPSNCFFPDLMICLRFRESLINADFGALWLRHLQATGYFKRAAAGTSASMVKINRGLLSQIRIAVPSIGEQKTIVNKINDIQLTIAALEDQLRAAVSMRVTLMSDLLTGRKRVTDALPMAAE
ncbi:restriction endonuclease subunit S [Agrobacterium tumefaciens]|uniref:restriction endonuclease subunit S n=1 Tax=Agrobacterium tumefaciens TaxID=358 RepID=UPI00384D87E7